ncbi:MAG: winged helix-turn-helix transcriptional regulator [Ktedonobacterales bacterium]|nr:winged helix-turn-helix transcriptional regulator [Ktedonobacterales bacterium]
MLEPSSAAEPTTWAALLEKKWALLLLFRLLPGPQRFGELRRAMPEVSAKQLCQRLRDLAEAELLTRQVVTTPPHVVYALTPRGEALRAALGALRQWSMDYLDSGTHSAACRTCPLWQGAARS